MFIRSWYAARSPGPKPSPNFTGRCRDALRTQRLPEPSAWIRRTHIRISVSRPSSSPGPRLPFPGSRSGSNRSVNNGCAAAASRSDHHCSLRTGSATGTAGSGLDATGAGTPCPGAASCPAGVP